MSKASAQSSDTTATGGQRKRRPRFYEPETPPQPTPPGQSAFVLHWGWQPVRKLSQPPTMLHSAHTVSRMVPAGHELKGQGSVVHDSVPSGMHSHVLQLTGSAMPVVPTA